MEYIDVNIPHTIEPETPDLINFENLDSIFDTYCSDCPALNMLPSNDTPSKKWDKVTSKLSELYLKNALRKSSR